MNELSVTVVIPAYNCAETIAKTLQAIGAQSFSGAVETIVVDDGSTDLTAEVVRKFPTVRYIHQPNAGPAAARNHGAREAKNAILCFTDSDCVPQPDWLQKLTAPLVDGKASVTAGSYGISNPGSLLARCVHQEILFRHRRLMPDFPKAFGSYNFGIRRDVFFEAGGFDTGYRFASGEDNDLSYKIRKNGHKIFFVRDALVAHHHPVSVVKYLREQFRHGFWRVKMYRAHPEMMTGDDYTFWKDPVEVLLVLLTGLSFGASVFSVEGAYVLLCLCFDFLLLLEIAFAVIFRLSFFGVFFYAAVMYLRAFFRTFGFLAGLCENFFTKSQKN